MTVYLQPFLSKSLIDQGIHAHQQDHEWKARGRFTLAVATGAVQAITYLALTILASALAFATLTASKTVNRQIRTCFDRSRASLIAVRIATIGIFKTGRPNEISQEINTRANQEREDFVKGLLENFKNYREDDGGRRLVKAAGRNGTTSRTDLFNLNARTLEGKLRGKINTALAYWPSDNEPEKKYAAFRQIREDLNAYAAKLRKKTRALPITENERHKFFVTKAAKLQRKLLKKFDEDVRIFRAQYAATDKKKFDSSAFDRGVKVLRQHVVDNLTKEVAQVQASGDKRYAYYAFDRKFPSLMSSQANQIENLAKARFDKRIWRRVKPWGEIIPGMNNACRQFDHWFDPSPSSSRGIFGFLWG